MTFTYSDTLTTARDKVRFELGDTASGNGIRPGGQNFTDEEITYAYGVEDSHVMKTVARLCEVLAREYSAYAGVQMLDGHSEGYNRMARDFAARAEELRERYGGDFGTDEDDSAIVSSFVTRVDGYSDDIAANEV